MNLSTEIVTISTKNPFKIARPGGSAGTGKIERIIVSVTLDGITGLGEAVPVPFYKQSRESITEALSRIADLLVDQHFDPDNPGALLQSLADNFSGDLAAVNAVDMALHDSRARKLNVPVYGLLEMNPSKNPPTSYSFGIQSPDELTKQLDAAEPFAAIKVKIGTDDDERRLEVIRSKFPDKQLYLDVNAAWSPEMALERIKSIARFQPYMIEQPIAPNQCEHMVRISAESPVPIFLDEDAIRPPDVERLVGCCSGINVKLVKCGGITHAIKMIRLARENDLQVMIGCMMETSLGISAAASIASLADIVDLDSHLLLVDDPFSGLLFEDGRVLPSNSPGLAIARRHAGVNSE